MAIKLFGKFEKSEKNIDNSTFETVSIRVHGLGSNANNSDITNKAFDKASSSIYGIPIVAKYTTENDIYGKEGDLTSHNQILRKDKDGRYVLQYDTVPLGFLSPNSNIYQEDVQEDDGTIRTYICADEIILWKRYDSTKKIINWLEDGIIPKVSMEIGDVDGFINENGFFEISSYEYLAICALGSDVEPCFDKADIQMFSEQSFNDLYKEMVCSFNKQFNKKEGGIDSVDKKLKLLKKYNIEQKDLDFSIEELSIEDLETKIKEFVEKFSLTAEQFREELINALSKEKFEDDWGWESSAYVYMDYNEKSKEVYAFDVKDNWKLVGFNYSLDGDTVVVDFESKKRKKFEIVDFDEGSTELSLFPQEAIDYAKKIKEKELQEEFASEKNKIEKAKDEIQSDFEEVKKEFQLFKDENQRLKDFEAKTLKEKREAEESELFGKFSKLNGIEEYEDLKKNSGNYSIEQLEKEIAFVAVKNDMVFSKKDPEKNKITLNYNHGLDNKPYGGIVEKLLKKNDKEE